ncbi:MAG: PaaI family thioesterase [Acidimicrobiia bacterium]|nr:PaaI family thioesterase [Acidimicrobiia bacterium]
MLSRKPESTPSEVLNQELRELINVVRTADFANTDITGVIERLRDLRAELQPCVVEGVRMQSSLVYRGLSADSANVGAALTHGPPRVPAGSNPRDFFPYSPLVGLLNPISPPASFTAVEAENYMDLYGEVTFPAVFNGPPGCVHGGALALLFDELLGCVGVVNGLGGFTGTLKVVYHSPTPLETPLTMRSWIEGVERRKVYCSAELHVDDRLCAEAEAIFIQSKSASERAKSASGSGAR